MYRKGKTVFAWATGGSLLQLGASAGDFPGTNGAVALARWMLQGWQSTEFKSPDKLGWTGSHVSYFVGKWFLPARLGSESRTTVGSACSLRGNRCFLELCSKASWARRCGSVIPALGRPTQKGCKFQASVHSITRPQFGGEGCLSSGAKNILFNTWYWANRISTCDRMELHPYLVLYTKINSKWIRDLRTLSPKNCKITRRNTERKNPWHLFWW